jgi:hypothetical protein
VVRDVDAAAPRFAVILRPAFDARLAFGLARIGVPTR